MGLQGDFKCSGRLNASNFTRKETPDSSSIGKREGCKCVDISCGMRCVLESEEDRVGYGGLQASKDIVIVCT